MRLGPYELRPRPLPAAVTLVLLPVLVALGFWQLDRAEQKRALLAQWEAGKGEPPVGDLSGGLAAEGVQRFTRVAARGRYDRAHQFLLDNRIRRGRPGYEVLTALRLEGRRAAVLVNRGWVPAGRSRRDLPALPAPGGEVRIRGALTEPPDVGLRLGPPDPGRGGWPKVVQYVEPARIQKQLGYPVLGRVVRLAEGEPHGFRRAWGPPVRFGPQRHRGYAVQWFGLGATLLVLFLVVNSQRREPRHAEPNPPESGPGGQVR